MTWYLTLHPPSHRPEAIPSRPVIDYLAGLPELRHSGPDGFESAAGGPWLHVVLAKTVAGGGYASNGEMPERIDLIELLCAYDGPPEWYEALACRIAAELDWIAVEESEERQVWPR
ncbi:hypothetical protein J5226_06845 [Lysobacter sp. K5869]|uniref:hypothetical protein n=1 Tax=Lysobacter sp. K5869 TaxID=2820808 RepID=UPI001C062B8B|nr:hypothetical protein [Lysobacter sp. K5869]QWP78108.1 hypothetical protein J5226_06845 [Lysobacter sp. K5869]